VTAGPPGRAPAPAESAAAESAPAEPVPGERPAGPRWRWLAATRRYLAGFSLPGLAGALAFYCLSLTPSLLPRAWYLQAVMSAVTAAIGYAVGLLAGWLLRSLIPWRPGRAVRRAGHVALAVAAVVLIPLFGVLGADWQHEIRELNGASQPPEADYILVVGVTLLLTAALITVSRGIRSHRTSRRTNAGTFPAAGTGVSPMMPKNLANAYRSGARRST